MAMSNTSDDLLSAWEAWNSEPSGNLPSELLRATVSSVEADSAFIHLICGHGALFKHVVGQLLPDRSSSEDFQRLWSIAEQCLAACPACIVAFHEAVVSSKDAASGHAAHQQGINLSR